MFSISPTTAVVTTRSFAAIVTQIEKPLDVTEIARRIGLVAFARHRHRPGLGRPVARANTDARGGPWHGQIEYLGLSQRNVTE